MAYDRRKVWNMAANISEYFERYNTSSDLASEIISWMDSDTAGSCLADIASDWDIDISECE